MKELIIGTRGSDLALWQARYLQEQLNQIQIKSSLKIIQTKGDIIQHLSFDKIEGKGFFTKELENALIAQDIDLAVHSMKDLPTAHPEGLVIAGVSERANPVDVLLIRKNAVDSAKPLKLSYKAIVGTSSARRKVQMKDLRSDVVIKDIRGNVPTRINKLRSGDFDAILLAAAGLERLQIDISDLEIIYFHPREFVPAPAQGVLAYQCHKENIDVRRVLKKIHQSEVAVCSNVERSVLKMADGGCHLPFGVYCEKDSMGHYHCSAAYASHISSPLVRVFLSQNTTYGLAEKIFQKIMNSIHEN